MLEPVGSYDRSCLLESLNVGCAKWSSVKAVGFLMLGVLILSGFYSRVLRRYD